LAQQTGMDNMPAAFLRADSIKTIEDFQQADFGTRIQFASAAAWSPNPDNPPFYLDLPVKDGKLQPLVLAKWSANKPLITLDQHISNLKKLKAIGFDAGTRDQAIAASIKELDAQLNKYGIKHTFEIYEGDHVNKIATRMATHMLVFFSNNLSFK
jgi:S-formylglutathione hydrolase